MTNGLLERGTSRAYLTIHDRLRRTYISFPMRKTSLPVRAVTSGGLALFLVESGGDRLGACGRDGCGLVFVDTSRNGRRAYCSSRCGNYVAVTRHRQELQR
ncbi:CGNR zinc finger domain-containing protein [Microbacterium sp. UFMG61]|uniref:CGNR zinc finger domain-containing protein n=1 Tax=Microbacterium sp. UFMG61 TaxID=2745935 RepID=UPI002B27A253|nr:CGNR zinc finger domain-containing protein [Microbacterium sp. UFMG61]